MSSRLGRLRLLTISFDALPENQRERFAEEWQSHIFDIPGEVGKLISAFELLAASREMGDSDDHAKLGGVWGLSRWGDAIGRHGKE